MAHDEKLQVALGSLAWAVVLTSTKLIVGVITGSLGILSEALHSGLDLVAAGMTVFAVHASSKPPDADHQFGHGKFENLSALFETLLLVATSGWIIREAIGRLAGESVEILNTPWSFAVMTMSIGIDWHRSRALKRAAIKYHSQALEADALHFSTDILSSFAVIAGLVGAWIGWVWADAVGALAVAVVILSAAGQLIRRSVNDLLDRAPAGVQQALAARIRAVPGVSTVSEVRVRPQGATLHVDVVVRLDGRITLIDAHATASAVEDAIRDGHPGADVNVHVEPAGEPASTIGAQARDRE